MRAPLWLASIQLLAFLAMPWPVGVLGAGREPAPRQQLLGVLQTRLLPPIVIGQIFDGLSPLAGVGGAGRV